MNRQRRAEIKRALRMMEEAHEILAECADQEDEAFDALPESIQESERGERMEECLEALDEALETIDDLIENISTVCEI